MSPMSRSLPVCCLIAELVLASAALAKTKQECLANCDAFNQQFDKACKAKGQGGQCDGRAKAMVGDLKKKCQEDCEAREEKKKQKQLKLRSGRGPG
jgi:hypothetical protein